MVGPLLALTLAGCSASCRKDASCYPLGTYIEPNQQLGASSAELCFDGDCATVEAIEDPHDIFTGFNSSFWEEGRTVQLRLTVFGAKGDVIDTITEERTMDSSGCACGVLFYDWKSGRLHRLN